MKTKIRASHPGARRSWPGRCFIVAALLIGIGLAQAQDKATDKETPKTTDKAADKAPGTAADKATDKPAEKAPEKPADTATDKDKAKEKEEAPLGFEGTEAGVNWIELSMGSVLTSGNRSQSEQSRRVPGSVFGGVSDFHFQKDVAKNTIFSVDGRGIFDSHDYKVGLGLKKEEVYFVRFNFENFRTFYNGDGGYFPPTDQYYSHSSHALELDRGEISVEGGLSLKDAPSFTFRYSHLYRDGEKSSTIWGQTHPSLTFPSVGLTPTIYDIDEKRDIFELGVKHHYKATDFGGGLRFEVGDLDNKRKISQYPGEPPVAGLPLDRKITDREGVSYDLFSAHAFSETWLKPDLLFSSGFMFVNYDGDTSGSRIYGSDFDVNYTPNGGNGAGYTDLSGNANKQEYVLNLNLMSTPAKNWSIVPSVRVQKNDWNADSRAIFTLANATSGPIDSDADGDSLDVRERLDIRYTGFTNWVLSAQGEWTEGQGNLNENGGVYLGSPIDRETDEDRFFQKYSLGVKWFPLRRVSVDFGGYYKNNRYDYDHQTDNTPNDSVNRYPAYLVMQSFETYDGNTRLTLRPLPNLTLVTRYEYQYSTVHTRPDKVSGLSEVESSEMTSHILGQNVSWSPWSRLYTQVGFNYVWSETKTPTSDYTQAVLNSQNNYWTMNVNSGFIIDNKTDLNLGYTYYRADDYENNSAYGVPYGSGAEMHGVTATLGRQLSKKVRLTLRYGYYHYTDELYGGHADYDAHTVYSSIQYRF